MKYLHIFSDDKATHVALIFVNKRAADPAIEDCSWFSVDGTFKIVPRQGQVFNLRSAQVLNIIADYNGHAVLLFTIVMTSRRLALYEKVLDVIKGKYPNFKPLQIMADYEAAMRTALKSRFPSSRLYGCRFHFAKAIYAKVKNFLQLGAFLRPRGNKTQKTLSHLVRQYMALPLLRQEDMKGQVERIGKEIRALATVHCTPKVVRSFNKLHNYITKYWMQYHGPANVSVFGATHKTNNIHERLNGALNGHIPLHPTLFTFLNRMKSLIFDNSICVINQIHQGRSDKNKVTTAARKLVEKAEEAENKYKLNIISAEGLLIEAAAHYDEDKIMEIFSNETDQEQREAATNAVGDLSTNDASTSNGTNMENSQTSVESEENSSNLMGTTERDEEIRNEPNLRDFDNDNWPVSNWLDSTNTQEQDAAASTPEVEDLTLLHPDSRPGGVRPDVNDLVVPICLLCSDNPTTQLLLKSCGHSFCQNCVDRPDFVVCPICRTPKGETVINHVGTMMLAWKRDAEAAFGAERWEARPEEDGIRPGDATVQQDLQRMSEELARSLELANQLLPPGEKVLTLLIKYVTALMLRSHLNGLMVTEFITI